MTAVREETQVVWHEEADTFDVRGLSRLQANMLQRALQRSPYDEVKAIRAEICDGLMRVLPRGRPL